MRKLRHQGQDWSEDDQRSSRHRGVDIRHSRTWDVPISKVTLRRRKQVVQSQYIPCIYKSLDSLLGQPAAAAILHNCTNNRMWTSADLTSSANIGEASSNQRTGWKSHCSLVTCTEVQFVPSTFPWPLMGKEIQHLKNIIWRTWVSRTALFQGWI